MSIMWQHLKCGEILFSKCFDSTYMMLIKDKTGFKLCSVELCLALYGRKYKYFIVLTIQNQHKVSIPEQFVIAKWNLSRLFHIQTRLQCPAMQIVICVQDELEISLMWHHTSNLSPWCLIWLPVKGSLHTNSCDRH